MFPLVISLLNAEPDFTAIRTSPTCMLVALRFPINSSRNNGQERDSGELKQRRRTTTRNTRPPGLQTPQPGELLLLAFHTSDEVLHEPELWGRPISMDFFLFQAPAIGHYIDAAGVVIEEIIEREPYSPQGEHQS